jgi:hypothetical protein
MFNAAPRPDSGKLHKIKPDQGFSLFAAGCTAIIGIPSIHTGIG